MRHPEPRHGVYAGVIPAHLDALAEAIVATTDGTKLGAESRAALRDLYQLLGGALPPGRLSPTGDL